MSPVGPFGLWASGASRLRSGQVACLRGRTLSECRRWKALCVMTASLLMSPRRRRWRLGLVAAPPQQAGEPGTRVLAPEPQSSGTQLPTWRVPSGQM